MSTKISDLGFPETVDSVTVFTYTVDLTNYSWGDGMIPITVADHTRALDRAPFPVGKAHEWIYLKSTDEDEVCEYFKQTMGEASAEFLVRLLERMVYGYLTDSRLTDFNFGLSPLFFRVQGSLEAAVNMAAAGESMPVDEKKSLLRYFGVGGTPYMHAAVWRNTHRGLVKETYHSYITEQWKKHFLAENIPIFSEYTNDLAENRNENRAAAKAEQRKATVVTVGKTSYTPALRILVLAALAQVTSSCVPFTNSDPTASCLFASSYARLTTNFNKVVHKTHSIVENETNIADSHFILSNRVTIGMYTTIDATSSLIPVTGFRGNHNGHRFYGEPLRQQTPEFEAWFNSSTTWGVRVIDIGTNITATFPLLTRGQHGSFGFVKTWNEYSAPKLLVVLVNVPSINHYCPQPICNPFISEGLDPSTKLNEVFSDIAGLRWNARQVQVIKFLNLNYAPSHSFWDNHCVLRRDCSNWTSFEVTVAVISCVATIVILYLTVIALVALYKKAKKVAAEELPRGVQTIRTVYVRDVGTETRVVSLKDHVPAVIFTTARSFSRAFSHVAFCACLAGFARGDVTFYSFAAAVSVFFSVSCLPIRPISRSSVEVVVTSLVVFQFLLTSDYYTFIKSNEGSGGAPPPRAEESIFNYAELVYAIAASAFLFTASRFVWPHSRQETISFKFVGHASPVVSESSGRRRIVREAKGKRTLVLGSGDQRAPKTRKDINLNATLTDMFGVEEANELDGLMSDCGFKEYQAMECYDIVSAMPVDQLSDRFGKNYHKFVETLKGFADVERHYMSPDDYYHEIGDDRHFVSKRESAGATGEILRVCRTVRRAVISTAHDVITVHGKRQQVFSKHVSIRRECDYTYADSWKASTLTSGPVYCKVSYMALVNDSPSLSTMWVQRGFIEDSGINELRHIEQLFDSELRSIRMVAKLMAKMESGFSTLQAFIPSISSPVPVPEVVVTPPEVQHVSEARGVIRKKVAPIAVSNAAAAVVILKDGAVGTYTPGSAVISSSGDIATCSHTCANDAVLTVKGKSTVQEGKKLNRKQTTLLAGLKGATSESLIGSSPLSPLKSYPAVYLFGPIDEAGVFQPDRQVTLTGFNTIGAHSYLQFVTVAHDDTLPMPQAVKYCARTGTHSLEFTIVKTRKCGQPGDHDAALILECQLYDLFLHGPKGVLQKQSASNWLVLASYLSGGIATQQRAGVVGSTFQKDFMNEKVVALSANIRDGKVAVMAANGRVVTPLLHLPGAVAHTASTTSDYIKGAGSSGAPLLLDEDNQSVPKLFGVHASSLPGSANYAVAFPDAAMLSSSFQDFCRQLSAGPR